MRAPGAMMAIGASGTSVGYVSGGCIDSDVRIRAQRAIENGKAETMRYGKGSPFIDIQLPCGGAIDLALLPNPDEKTVRETVRKLESKSSVQLNIASGNINLANDTSYVDHRFSYRPKLNLRIAGRGIEPVALSRIASAGGLSCELWSPDPECIAFAEAAHEVESVLLSSPADLPGLNDSDETAFILMFHDKEWETALLRQAVAGAAFYIGAVGSKATHADRQSQLIEHGLSEEELARIRGPIGLVPSMRDASMLAYSILAEVVHVFHNHVGVDA